MYKTKILLSAAALALLAFPALATEEGGYRSGGHHPRLEEVDTNGDGLVSEAEFLAKAKERFRRMDSNGDGKISREEHRQGREKMRERMKERRENRRGRDE